MSTPTEALARAQVPPLPVSLREAFLYWLKLGFISFGGPAGQISMMHTELVERRRWISEHRFLHALNYTMVLPGPEAQQLATYIGWLMHGTLGGVMAGVLFVLPSLGILIALTWIYLGLILPSFGVELPFVKTMVLVTFVVGLLPVLGNLISNIGAKDLAAAFGAGAASHAGLRIDAGDKLAIDPVGDPPLVDGP